MDWGSLKSKLVKEVTQTWRATNNGKLVGSVDWRIWRGWRIIQVRLPKGLIWEQKMVIRACLGIPEIMPSYWEWQDQARRSLCFRVNWEETKYRYPCFTFRKANSVDPDGATATTWDWKPLLCDVTLKRRTEDSTIWGEKEIEVRLGECFNIHVVLTKMKVLVAWLCPILCDPMDCNPPGFSVHGVLSARIPEWVAISFSRGSVWPRDQTWVTFITGRFFYCLSHQAAHGVIVLMFESHSLTRQSFFSWNVSSTFLHWYQAILEGGSLLHF